MKDKYKFNTTELFNFSRNSYLERTSRPIYAIVFLLPFIIFYELGTLFINTDTLNQTQVRVVAFVWLQNLLEYLGIASKLAWVAPPVVIVAILIALQLASRKTWYFNVGDIVPMAIECALLAVPLIVLSLLLSSPTQPQSNTVNFTTNSITLIQSKAMPDCHLNAIKTSQSFTGDSGYRVEGNSLLADIVSGIGAGIYEELIFRLILINLLMILFQDVLRIDQGNSVILSVFISAGLFSAHHHISSPFNWTEFGFRTIAGIYFAGLFAIRGFGITAGTHAFYDIIATSISAIFFQH